MHNRLSDMDLQTRPLKPVFHFLAMTSSPGDSSKLADHLTMVREVSAISAY